MNKVILFDIDYTLFNAKNYRNSFLSALQKEIGFSDSKQFYISADEAYIESKNIVGFFDPHAFLELLGKKLDKELSIVKLQKIITNENVFSESLYEDTEEVVKELSKENNITLGIFSAGLIDIQRPKIKLIEPFLHQEHIHIFAFKKGKALPELLKKYENSKLFMIDDIAEILYKAKQINDNITTILIERENSPQVYKQYPNFIPDKTIKNLREVIEIIKNS